MQKLQQELPSVNLITYAIIQTNYVKCKDFLNSCIKFYSIFILKRQKEEQEMRASLEIGDEIITIGGIVGRVVTIREEDIVIETGAER